MEVDEDDEETEEHVDPSPAITLQHRNTSALTAEMLTLNGGTTSCGSFWSQVAGSLVVADHVANWQYRRTSPHASSV